MPWALTVGTPAVGAVTGLAVRPLTTRPYAATCVGVDKKVVRPPTCSGDDDGDVRMRAGRYGATGLDDQIFTTRRADH